MSNETKSQAEDDVITHGHTTLIARFLWAMAGPLMMLGALVLAAKTPRWLSLWEGVYVGVIGVMVWGRYLEQKSGHGTTLYNEPSTWGHFKSYTLKLVILAVAFWAAAKTGGSYLFPAV